jgi:hypothetical protein
MKIHGIDYRWNEVKSWCKHHSFYIFLLASATVASIYIISNYLIFIGVEVKKPDVKKSTGITVISTTVIPDPIYQLSQPWAAQILCVDGEKVFVASGIAAVKLEGLCE